MSITLSVALSEWIENDFQSCFAEEVKNSMGIHILLFIQFKCYRQSGILCPLSIYWVANCAVNLSHLVCTVLLDVREYFPTFALTGAGQLCSLLSGKIVAACFFFARKIGFRTLCACVEEAWLLIYIPFIVNFVRGIDFFFKLCSWKCLKKIFKLVWKIESLIMQ